MDLQLRLSYPGGPDEVAGLLADHAFVEQLCAESHAVEHEVSITGSAAGAFTVTTTRVLPTSELPSAVRRFLGEHLRVVQVDAWDAAAPDGSRTGTTSLDVTGAPLRARATSTLQRTANGSEQALSGELKASIPLLGSKVEQAAAPILVAALRDQEQLAGTRLHR